VLRRLLLFLYLWLMGGWWLCYLLLQRPHQL
jgi:hypothetical protein